MPENLDKVKLKKLSTIDEFEVWQVDGTYIRNNIDREFTNFGQHFRFPFIPKHEFWIDKEHSHDETHYFVSHLIVEWSMMNDGMSYDEAVGYGDRAELKERKKSLLLKKVEKELEKPEVKVPKEMYVKLLASYEGVDVWVINGELVRNLYYVEFTEGGHHFIYKWVPRNEVWLDDDLDPKEMDYVLLHEMHERYLMSKGMDYSPAHHSSSIIEYKCRRDPSLLKKYLAEQTALNKF